MEEIKLNESEIIILKDKLKDLFNEGCIIKKELETHTSKDELFSRWKLSLYGTKVNDYLYIWGLFKLPKEEIPKEIAKLKTIWNEDWERKGDNYREYFEGFKGEFVKLLKKKK